MPSAGRLFVTTLGAFVTTCHVFPFFMRKFVMKNCRVPSSLSPSATGQQAAATLRLKIKINTLPI